MKNMNLIIFSIQEIVLLLFQNIVPATILTMCQIIDLPSFVILLQVCFLRKAMSLSIIIHTEINFFWQQSITGRNLHLQCGIFFFILQIRDFECPCYFFFYIYYISYIFLHLKKKRKLFCSIIKHYTIVLIL